MMQQLRTWWTVIPTMITLSVGAQSNWVDESPHKSGFITVNKVKLHYLDWGGAGETLLFLHGMNGTAHFYDHFAPKFTNQFHVLALTRRGHGDSEMPESGYDTATLVEDVRQFLDALKLQRVVLAGHSFAGDELTRLPGLIPTASSNSSILIPPTTIREFGESSCGSLCTAGCRMVCPPKRKANHRTAGADGLCEHRGRRSVE